MKLKNFKEILDYVEESIKYGRNDTDDTVILTAGAYLVILREIKKLRKDVDKLKGNK